MVLLIDNLASPPEDKLPRHDLISRPKLHSSHFNSLNGERRALQVVELYHYYQQANGPA